MPTNYYKVKFKGGCIYPACKNRKQAKIVAQAERIKLGLSYKIISVEKVKYRII